MPGSDSRIEVVQLDALVVVKIINHAKDNLPDLVTGQLLGLDVGSTLEITNSFPFPNRIAETEEETESEALGGAEYQLEMMVRLREGNVDDNTVGWYSSTYMGSFVNESTLETQFNYQGSRSIKRSVLVIYDPLKTSQGVLSLKALRLTNKFMDLYKEQKFTKDVIARIGLSFDDIFEEIPIKIHNNLLTKALLWELDEYAEMDPDFERLELSTNPFLEKNLEFLIECLDDLSQEQNKFTYHQRTVQRQLQQQAQWLQKRKSENAIRKSKGEEPLPEEDPTNSIFKSTPEPSRLESLLITNQINNYCKQINHFAGNSFTKLFLVGGLFKE